MKVKIFFVLLLCALHQAYGSKSTKEKGGSRLMKWAKKSLIAVAVNYGACEVVNVAKPQVADSISVVCKYNVPDRNAYMMMTFVMCAKDQEFEKYMFDNSQNCPKIKDLYNQAKSDGNCALNTPKIIPNGALARFRGEQLSHKINVEMMKEYLLSYSGCSKCGESVSDFLKSDVFPKTNFDFFQFTSLLEVAKIAYPDDTERPIKMALDNEYKDVNVEDAKRMLELTMLAFPNDTEEAVLWALSLDNEFRNMNAEYVKRALELSKLAYPNSTHGPAAMEMRSEYKYFNVEHAKKLFKLTKLIHPNDTGTAILMTLRGEFKDVNVDNAKRVLELTNFFHPNDTSAAVLMALRFEKDVNGEHAKKLFELTKLAFPDMKVAVSEALKPKYKGVDVEKVNKKYEELKNSWSWYLSSEQSIIKEAFKVTYPEVVKEDF